MSRLVRLYPAAWRERYEAEVRAALASRPVTHRDRLGLLRGALDAWLHPELVAPASAELALEGTGSMVVDAPAPTPWVPFLGAVAAGAFVLAAFAVLGRPSGLYGTQHPQSVLLAVATFALGAALCCRRGAPLARLGGLAMIAITCALLAMGWYTDDLTPAIGLGVGGAIAGLGLVIDAAPGRWTGVALLGTSGALAIAIRAGSIRGTALVLLATALISLRIAAPGPQPRWRRVVAAGAGGLAAVALVTMGLAATDPWSTHDGYALGCHVDAPTCLAIADVMAPAIRAHFQGGVVLAVEVREDGQVWACWRDDGVGRAGECRLGSPNGWPAGPAGSI